MAKVIPSSPGIAPTRARNIKGFLFLKKSDKGGITTAPIMPPMIISPPRLPACTTVKPLGLIMSSIHVVTPLKIPRPTKNTTMRIIKSLCLSICFKPSSISALSSWPGRHGGVGGFSLARTIKVNADTMATTP